MEIMYPLVLKKSEGKWVGCLVDEPSICCAGESMNDALNHLQYLTNKWIERKLMNEEILPESSDVDSVYGIVVDVGEMVSYVLLDSEDYLKFKN